MILWPPKQFWGLGLQITPKYLGQQLQKVMEKHHHLAGKMPVDPKARSPRRNLGQTCDFIAPEAGSGLRARFERSLDRWRGLVGAGR